MTDLASASVGLEPAVVQADTERAEDDGIKRKKLPFGTYLAGAWMIALIVAILGASYLPLSDPNASIGGLKEVAPFQVSGHPLGGDGNGRDLLARTIYGARISMEVAVCAVLFGLFIGGALGLLSGYYRGRVGNVLVSLFDILLAIPPLVLALALVAVLKGDPSADNGLPTVLILIIALGVVSIPILARITRANTLAWAQRDFVTAARAQGAKNSRIILREILPNVLPAMISISLLGIAVTIIAEGGLGILGVSVEPPTATWGTIIADGRTALRDSPFIVFVPCIAIFLTVLSLNYLGDVVRDRFDVRESAL
jgi:peptide/nickel transport system permease protein